MTSGGADHAIAYRCRFHPSSPLWVPLLFPLFALCICFQWGGDIAGQLFVSRSKPIRKLLSNGHAFTFLRVSLFLPPNPPPLSPIWTSAQATSTSESISSSEFSCRDIYLLSLSLPCAYIRCKSHTGSWYGYMFLYKSESRQLRTG